MTQLEKAVPSIVAAAASDKKLKADTAALENRCKEREASPEGYPSENDDGAPDYVYEEHPGGDGDDVAGDTDDDDELLGNNDSLQAAMDAAVIALRAPRRATRRRR